MSDIIRGGEGTLPDELRAAYDHVKERGVTREAMRYPAGELLYLFVISELAKALEEIRDSGGPWSSKLAASALEGGVRDAVD